MGMHVRGRDRCAEPDASGGGEDTVSGGTDDYSERSVSREPSSRLSISDEDVGSGTGAVPLTGGRDWDDWDRDPGDELCSLRGVLVCRAGLGYVVRPVDFSHSLDQVSATTQTSPIIMLHSNLSCSDHMQIAARYQISGRLFIASRDRVNSHPLPYPNESTLHDGAS